jgi:hypothetical protein
MRVLTYVTALAALLPGTVTAQTGPVRSELDDLAGVQLPAVDLMQAELADAKRQLFDEVAHFAVPIEVDYPFFNGKLDQDGADVRWRLRLRSPGAFSLSLAFGRYRMPPGGRLTIASADGSERIGPFTERENEDHGQLWTPPLSTDDVILEYRFTRAAIELLLSGEDSYEVRLTRVHHGYAGFGEKAPLSGLCQRDVACFDDPLWHDAARSVALISIEGVRFCSGFMVNNTALDGKPFFITAAHCGVTRENAASVVAMWKFESSFCRDELEIALEAPRPPSDSFQTGARLLASYLPTDVTLLELDDLPDPRSNVHYAGWDRSAVSPEGPFTAIHHPNTDMKRLSVDDDDRAPATFFRLDREEKRGDHLRVGAWEIGSTEGGSSGSPLFDQNQRAIGQLHGGYAECGEKKSDWFGRLSVSWTGGGKRGQRLSDWLDPLETEAVTLDGLDASELLASELE